MRAARLYQRARLLQLTALELHCADLAVQDASCRALLQVFFLPLDTDEDTGQLCPPSCRLLLLPAVPAIAKLPNDLVHYTDYYVGIKADYVI